MSPSAVRRVALAAAMALALAASLVAAATPAAAHGVEGGSLPAPPWLLGYAGAFAVLITAAALRATWLTPRRVPAARVATTGDQPHPVVSTSLVVAGWAAGTLVLAAVLVAAFVGPDSPAANVAPVAVLVVWWVGLPVLSVGLGDVMRRINPFQLPAAALERLREAPRDASDARGAPPWTAAALLGAFAWFLLAYHRPGSPRALGVFLVVYAAAVLAGAVRWGRAWLAAGEGFGGLSAAVALLSWRAGDRRLVPGLAPLAVVLIGATAFDGLTSTSFWADVVGTSRGWSRTLLSSVGLVWVTAIVAGVYLLAVRVADPPAPDDAATAHRPLAGPLGLALVPMALGWFVAHDLTLLLAEGQNFLVLASDPLGEGWDLFGTRDNVIDFGLVEARWVRWVQLAALLVGHVAAVVLAHDVALRLRRPRLALRATWAVAVVAAVSIVTGTLMVLG